MLDLNLGRSTASAHLLTGLASELGISPTEILQGTGITLPELEDATAEIQARQELRLIENLVSRLAGPGSPDPLIAGMQAGARYHLTSYGIWGFALISSPDFRSVVNLAARYLELTYVFSRIRFEESGGWLRITFEDNGIPEAVRPFLILRDMAAIRTLGGELFGGPIPLQAIHLTLEAPERDEALCDFFACPISYTKSVNQMLINATMLDQPLPQANPHTARLCEQQCAELLNKRKQLTGTAGAVREKLYRFGPARSMEDIADELCMTTRTLRRRLLLQGVTWRELVQEVRETFAEELLATGHIRVEDIACRLGYNDPANFIHAFRRWKGMTPRQYQRQRLQSQQEGRE